MSKTEIEKLINEADVYFDNNEYEKALEILRQILVLEPDNFEVEDKIMFLEEELGIEEDVAIEEDDGNKKDEPEAEQDDNEIFKHDGFLYTISEDNTILTGGLDKNNVKIENKSITIPSEINNMPVSGVTLIANPNLVGLGRLEEFLNIEDDVEKDKKISMYIFTIETQIIETYSYLLDYQGLKFNFKLSPKINVIKEFAFSGANFENFSLHDGVELIKPFAFSFCNIDNEFSTLNAEIDQYGFYKSGVKKICIDSDISESDFMESSKLEEVFIGYNSDIPYKGFKNCSNLKSINIEQNSETLSIRTSVFEGCSSLENFNLSIPGNTIHTFIGNKAFSMCSSLEYFDFDTMRVSRIGKGAFELTSLRKIVIGAEINYVDDRAFAQISGLETIEIRSKNITRNIMKDSYFSALNLKEQVFVACEPPKNSYIEIILPNVDLLPENNEQVRALDNVLSISPFTERRYCY